MIKERRGLSPIIATVLLVSMAIVLSLIVFLWAKGFIAEKTQKDLGRGPEPIENFCDKIDFSADAVRDDDEVCINNNGNIPIYGAEVRKIGLGSVKNVGVLDTTLTKGAGGCFNFDFSDSSININSGDEIVVVPIILGENEEYKKSYTCDEDFGNIIKVI